LLDSCKHFDETDDLEAEIDVVANGAGEPLRLQL
jgi:hypothetical protein